MGAARKFGTREKERLWLKDERERERLKEGKERVFNVKIRAIVRKGRKRKRPKTGLAQRTLLPSAASSQVHILSVSCGCRQTRKNRARGGHRTGRVGKARGEEKTRAHLIGRKGEKRKRERGGAKTSYFWERGAKRKRKVKDHYPRPSLSISIPLRAAI